MRYRYSICVLLHYICLYLYEKHIHAKDNDAKDVPHIVYRYIMFIIKAFAFKHK